MTKHRRIGLVGVVGVLSIALAFCVGYLKGNDAGAEWTFRRLGMAVSKVPIRPGRIRASARMIGGMK